MAAFRYEAVDGAGKTVSGLVEADTARHARSRLRSQGLLPSALEPLAERAREKRASGSIGAAELALVTRQLATLLESGLTIERALTALIDEAPDARTREVLTGVKAEIVAGAGLAGALGVYRASFPDFYCALVRGGEQSGALPVVLQHLADHLEARQAMRQKTTLALLYPTLVTVVAVLIVAGLLGYVVPQVVQVFEQSRQALPLTTRILIAASDFLQVAGPWLALLFAVSLVAGRYALRVPDVRKRWHTLVLRLPVAGALVRSADCARFAATVAILAAGGVPLVQALEAGANAMTNLALRDSARNAAALVREGASLARALGSVRVFPPMLVHLVASGEASGSLARMLERGARLENQAFERRLAFIMTLLEPALILAMGILVLFIVLAILMPIISLNQLVR